MRSSTIRREDRLYLDVRIANSKLTADDRFFSLLEYYARAQDSVLRERAVCRSSAACTPPTVPT